jgi:hypothetical protein
MTEWPLTPRKERDGLGFINEQWYEVERLWKEVTLEGKDRKESGWQGVHVRARITEYVGMKVFLISEAVSRERKTCELKSIDVDF